MKKILIFGGNGFVGRNLAHLAKARGWQVCIVDNVYRPGTEDIRLRAVNITDEESVERIIDIERPDVAVNAAAISDIDRAEQEQELAWKVNVASTKFIAQACAQYGIRHIFISSDAVFDGKSNFYSEDDGTNPVNYYGYTKVEAEKAILAVHPQAVVIRVSQVLGFPVASGSLVTSSNSFLAGLESRLKAGVEILCPVDEIRTPVDVITLAECILELAENDFSGILHIGATESIDRFTLTRRLALEMHLDEKLVKPQDSQTSIPGRAPRHKNGVLNISRAQSVLTTQLPSLDEAIHRALTQRL